MLPCHLPGKAVNQIFSTFCISRESKEFLCSVVSHENNRAQRIHIFKIFTSIYFIIMSSVHHISGPHVVLVLPILTSPVLAVWLFRNNSWNVSLKQFFSPRLLISLALVVQPGGRPQHSRRNSHSSLTSVMNDAVRLRLPALCKTQVCVCVMSLHCALEQKLHLKDSEDEKDKAVRVHFLVKFGCKCCSNPAFF